MSKTYTVTVEVKGAESRMDACEVVEWLIQAGMDSALESVRYLDEEPELKDDVRREWLCEVNVMGGVA